MTDDQARQSLPSAPPSSDSELPDEPITPRWLTWVGSLCVVALGLVVISVFASVGSAESRATTVPSGQVSGPAAVGAAAD